MFNRRFCGCLAGVLSIITAACATADEASFPFVIPWDDAEPGTATDVSFLNTVPAGANGRIVVRSGRFVEEKTGRPVRFLGTNLSANHNFPTREDAAKVARHMAKYGINLVRLHHMDNSWNLAKGTGIWKADDPRRLELDPDRLDRLDYLVNQLKANGIYVNINLKVSKNLSEADGFAPGIAQIPWGYQKRVDIFNARMIELQKDFARRLLTHVNPYTGLSYAEDPCVAVVEINNENSLVSFSRSAPGEGLAQMPEPFRGELAALWNRWLSDRYGSDEALRAAWASAAPEELPPPVAPDARWKLSVQGQAKATLHLPGDDRSIAAAPEVRVTQAGRADWHVQLHIPQIDLLEGRYYTLRFRAKAPQPRSLRVSAMQSRGGFRNNGLSQSVKLDTDWRDFTFAFKAVNIDPGYTRLTFNLGGDASTVWLDGVQLQDGAHGAGLQTGQSLAHANIELPTSMTEAQRRDWVQFLTEIEHDYALDMRNYLRDELGVKACIIDTQIAWGGLTAYTREAEMDFADTHAYWQHPRFPAGGWSESNWTLESRSLVNAWAHGESGTLDRIVQSRWAGRPFSVSEYDHPAPNEFAVETMPLYAGFAAAQDWDAIYSFDYGPYGQAYTNDRISRFFDQANHPGKFAFYPAAAMIFRAGLLQPAPNRYVLQMPSKPYELHNHVDALWHEAGAPSGLSAFLSHQWAVDPQPDPSVTQPVLVEAALTTDSGSTMRLDKVADGGIFVAHSPAAVIVVGQVGGQTVQAGDVTLQFDTFPTGFAALTLTAMDGRPLADSGRILLTLAGKAENTDMTWNAEHTSVADQWGRGPVRMLSVPMSLTMKAEGARIAHALDAGGRRRTQVPLHAVEPGRIRLTTSPADATAWYELTSASDE